MQKIEMEEADKVSGRSVVFIKMPLPRGSITSHFQTNELKQLYFTFNVHSWEIATKQTLLIWKAALGALLKTTEMFLKLDFRKKEKKIIFPT